MELDVSLAILLSGMVGTAVLAKVTHLPITALEIVAGIVLVATLGFQLPTGADSFVVLGSLLIVFLAGLETRWEFLKENLRAALRVGLPGFLLPFLGLLALFRLELHLPLLVSVIGATALADTSISIVYSTLHQYSVSELPFGRLVLASTLMVNLAEDATVTGATLLSGGVLLLTVAMLGALGAAALALPRLSRFLSDRYRSAFANLPTRALLLSLVVLGALSAMVSVPGILFVFLMGLVFSKYCPPALGRDLRNFAFALFVPLYFVAVGLRVDVGFVVAQLPLLLGLVGVASALKVAGLLPGARKVFPGPLAPSVVALMNTRLTSATVILLLTLSLGLIPVGFYSLLISAVVILALGSSLALRAFPAFSSEEAARRVFRPGSAPPAATPGG